MKFIHLLQQNLKFSNIHDLGQKLYFDSLLFVKIRLLYIIKEKQGFLETIITSFLNNQRILIFPKEVNQWFLVKVFSYLPLGQNKPKNMVG